MKDLRASPFLLTYDTLVRAKVLARNERGWSVPSDPNSSGARVQVEPQAMNAPTRGDATGPTQIEVNWSSLTTPEDGGSAVLSYHLQYDAGSNAVNWIDVIGLSPDSIATNVIVSTNIESGTTYGFRVRARNIFGWGPYSAVTYIKAAREPDVPAAPTTSIDSETGGIAITWTAPDERGDTITAYLIEIANKAGDSWTTHTSCDGSSPSVIEALRCVVPMSALTEVPFNYVFDDLVVVRVSASNSFGFGVKSPASDETGARVRSVPSQMLPPTEDISSTDTTITLNWVGLEGVSAGNSEVLAYSLYWDQGDSNAEVTTELVDALVTTFTVNSVEGGMTYRFRVRARNIYGYGPYSDVLEVIPDDAPGKVDIPTVALSSTDPTEVEISWAAPDDHSSPITSYEILFLMSNGEFAHELTRCDGELPTVLAERKCSVPMSTIRTLTGLPRDSLIRVKVMASNAKGNGQFSEVNTVGATVETEPTNLSVVSIDMSQTTNTATRVKWTALTGSRRGGKDVLITLYELFWDQGSDNWVSLTTTSDL